MLLWCISFCRCIQIKNRSESTEIISMRSETNHTRIEYLLKKYNDLWKYTEQEQTNIPISEPSEIIVDNI